MFKGAHIIKNKSCEFVGTRFHLQLHINGHYIYLFRYDDEVTTEILRENVELLKLVLNYLRDSNIYLPYTISKLLEPALVHQDIKKVSNDLENLINELNEKYLYIDDILEG